MRFESFTRFRRVYVFWTGVVWFVVLMLVNAYHWYFLKDPKTGACGLGVSLELVLGTAFFLGFLSFVGGAVQARKGFLSKTFELDQEDRKQLDAYKPPKTDAPLFVRATWAGIGFVMSHGLLLAVLIYSFFPEGLSNVWLVFGISAYFALAAMGWAAFSAWFSMARLHKKVRSHRTHKISVFRYTFLQNALAALVVNVPLGYFYGHLKFPALAQKISETTGGRPLVPFLALAADIGFTAFIIAFFTGMTIRNKVLGEIFVDVEVAGYKGPAFRGLKWHWWYSLVVAAAAFSVLWALGNLFPGHALSVGWAMTLKWALQGLVGMSVGYVAARLSLDEIMAAGPGSHPLNPAELA